MTIGRLLTGIAFMLLTAAPALAQSGFDRPGGDYTSFQVRTGDPAICATRCEREGRCRAWSFAYPAPPSRPVAMCWLKNQVTAAEENESSVSGVKGAGVVEPKVENTEFAIDRVGGDYRNFETKPDSAGESCKAACEGDAKCRAWTHVRPGYIGPQARCFLKSEIKRPRKKPCCISGVVR